MSFAARLKEKRLKAGLSLQDLADAVGASKAHVWDLETGNSKNPSADLLLKLSEKLKTTVGWLLGQEVEEEGQAGVMFRQLKELSEDDQALIQLIIDQRRQQQKDRDKKNAEGDGDADERMDLADIGNAVDLAKAVLRQIPDLKPPIPIYEIALASGITDIREEALSGMEGALVTDDDKRDGTIVVNSKSFPRAVGSALVTSSATS